jgi:hypothetical protein
LTRPVLVPAVAGLVILVLSVSLFIYEHYAKEGYARNNIEYVAGLLSNGHSSIIDNDGLGTPIEKYFL